MWDGALTGEHRGELYDSCFSLLCGCGLKSYESGKKGLFELCLCVLRMVCVSGRVVGGESLESLLSMLGGLRSSSVDGGECGELLRGLELLKLLCGVLREVRVDDGVV